MALTIIALLMGSAVGATGASPEFRLDLRGLGPWQRHTARASEPLAFSSSWAANAAADAKAVVKVMPVLKTKPKYLVIDLSGGTNATHYPISSLDEVPGGSWSDEYKTSKLVLRHIPAGSFVMGGRATDYPGAVNTNLHMVTITRDFYMGVFEVTQRQWELVMGTRPSAFTNEACYATRPVEQISYQNIRGNGIGLCWPESRDVDFGSFVDMMRRKSGMNGLDLPTEAQWEYACRAGTTTALSNGKNLSGMTNAVELASFARYAFNSGWSKDDYLAVSDGYRWTNYWCTTDMGTAKVGSYQKNPFDLYDMEGNVCEICLDVYTNLLFGCVDPVGPSSSLWNRRPYRGGGWRFEAYACASGYRKQDDLRYWSRAFSCGFRLCLQGGDIPDFASASTLVNESGAGSQSWTPTRSGAYYLTHSTMNGATNAQLMSAWFEVPGCELMLEPQGELTNGVSVAITGAGEGWTVYYTTNGLAPSQASEKYTGPFSLPESATVRAVAYNTQGVASEETTTSFTLHDALSVVGAVARPRYPWNGMVDVDCEIKGDPEAKYEVELVVRDLEGGTNIEVRTVGADHRAARNRGDNETAFGSDYGALGDRVLPPGAYRLTWNADADIAYDHDFPRVAVTVKATKQSVLAGYARSFAISTDGYVGAETLTNVPVLVRLSSAIEGFDYRDFASPSNGADLAFFDANEQALPYEIDEWHTNGESLVWVKLPTLAKGARFTCAYGRDSSKNGRVLDSMAAKHEVWREYAGVWHMNEDSGTAFDSTEHGLDALPSFRTNNAYVSEMVGVRNGACGCSRNNANAYRNGGNFLLIPSYDNLKLGSRFVVSGWFKANDPEAGITQNFRLFTRKNEYFDDNGWECELNNTYFAHARGASQYAVYFAPSDVVSKWTCCSFAFDGERLRCYTNGVFCTPQLKKPNAPSTIARESISPASDNGRPLLIGRESFPGQYDEIRLRGGSLSADRIKADYDMIAKRNFCTYGAVRKGVGE